MPVLELSAAGQLRAALISVCVTLAAMCISILSSAAQAAVVSAPLERVLQPHLRDTDDRQVAAARGRQSPAAAAAEPRWRPTPVQNLGRHVLNARQTGSESTSTTSPSATPTSPNFPFDNNGRPTAALSIFVSAGSPSPEPEAFLLGHCPGALEESIALFVLVVAFVLLRIFVRNRRLRRLGLLPGDLVGSRMLGPAREIEDTLTPPKLWEAKIMDLEEVQKLRATRAAPVNKIQDWDGIMPIAAAFPTQLYAELSPDAPKTDGKTATTYPPTSNATPNQNGIVSSGRGLRRLLRLSGHQQNGLPNGNGALPTEVTDGNNANKAGMELPSQVAENEVPMPAAVNVTVLIAMPSPKTVFPSARQMKPKKSALSFVSALSASASKPSLIPAQLSTTKVDEVDEEYSVEVKGKSRREPSLRSVRTGVSATSFAEARREAFFKTEAGMDEMELPGADHRSEYGFDNDDDEEEELPELMFGTASVPMYRDWAMHGSSSSSSVPVPEDLIIPTKGDLLQLLNTARQVKERKTLNAVAQLKAAAAKEEMVEQDGEADGAAPLSTDFGVNAAAASTPAGAEVGGGGGERRSSLTTMDMDVAESAMHPRFSGVGRTADATSSAENRQSMGTASVHGAGGGSNYGDALSGILGNEGRNMSLDDPERRRSSWLSREMNGFTTAHGYASTSQANLEARSTHTDDALLHTGGSTQNEHTTANR
ncbi:hypothetical protein OC846_000195 [Tilletia horrida]|uniref:Uncharacterized protein n=1 Tax=Tilletia horrida TaxID=155126 RepID=A0AAN6JU53_9BASI|nr:hypothetical protein OC846_000195 [Tilletia horrida]